jgi:hypothetical protein
VEPEEAERVIRFEGVLRGPWLERFLTRRDGYSLTLTQAVEELIAVGALELELTRGGLKQGEVEITHVAVSAPRPT